MKPNLVKAAMFAFVPLLLNCSEGGDGRQSPRPPLAEAGEDQLTRPGFAVELDGSASAPTRGGELEYEWRLKETPEGGQAYFAQAASAAVSFIPESPGSYLLELKVVETAGGEQAAGADETIVTADWAHCPAPYKIEETCLLEPERNTVAYRGRLYSFPDETPISGALVEAAIPGAGGGYAASSQSGGVIEILSLPPALVVDICASGAGAAATCEYGKPLIEATAYVVEEDYPDYILPAFVSDQVGEGETLVVGFVRCEGAAKAGLTVSAVREEQRVYYYADRLPDINAEKTDDLFAAFAIIVPGEGDLVVQAFNGGVLVASKAARTVLGSVTFVRLEY